MVQLGLVNVVPARHGLTELHTAADIALVVDVLALPALEAEMVAVRVAIGHQRDKALATLSDAWQLRHVPLLQHTHIYNEGPIIIVSTNQFIIATRIAVTIDIEMFAQMRHTVGTQLQRIDEVDLHLR